MASRELRLDYTRALAAMDPERIVDTLSDEVVITVAVHDAPLVGKDVARFLFGVLGEELRGFQVTDELIEGASAAVSFEAGIRERTAQGLNLLRLDENGQVRELTVYFRPLESLQLVAEVVGPRMAARFGAPG